MARITSQYLCGMYFKASGRVNPDTQKYDSYYRLVERYRNAEGRLCHRTILKAGQEISVRRCSVPEQKLKQSLEVLELKQRPFTKIKSVVHKQKLRKPDSLVYARIPSGVIRNVG